MSSAIAGKFAFEDCITLDTDNDEHGGCAGLIR